MKKLILTLCIIFGIIYLPSFASADNTSNGYLIKINRSANLMKISALNDIGSMEPVSAENGIFYVDSLDDLPCSIDDDIIEHIEPNIMMKLAYIPNDTQYSMLWHMNTINAPAMWESGCHGEGIKIAVIDTGVNAHSDLIGNILDGYNFVDQNTDVTDSMSHGTIVAGIIAAVGDNNYLTTGVAYRSKIVPLKCFNAETSSVKYAISAIYAAVDKYDCKVINISAGTSQKSDLLEQAIDHAIQKGAIIVAAAGNHDNINSFNQIDYPAGYENVTSVGSVDKNNVISSFSNYNNMLNVVAPGEKVLSLSSTSNNNLCYGNGTSFACPVVASAAALCLNIKPDLTNAEFMEMIKTTSTDLGTAGKDDYYGYGLLNLKAILDYLLNGKDYFVSPYDAQSDNSSITVYNNTNKQFDGFGILFDGQKRSLLPLSIDGGNGARIVFEPESSEFSYKLWSSNLKPLESKNYK